MRRIVSVAIIVFASLGAEGGSLNLYEWIGVAPTVVTGEAAGPDGKFVRVRLSEVLRGNGTVGEVVLVDLRHANRERDIEVFRRALRMPTGNRYLLLLDLATVRGRGGRAVHRLVRGVEGARELPAEGSEAWVSAVRRFVDVQDSKDDLHTWRSLREMLEETNPILIDTALSQFLKFRRGDLELIATIRPLLDHPRNPLREQAALLVHQILKRKPGQSVPESTRLQAELVSRARRDSSVEVRVAATEALEALDGATVEEILREIASDDPDQQVRYTAERLIYDREQQRLEDGARQRLAN